MSVHVDELHSEVVPFGRSAGGVPERRAEPVGAVEDRWRETRGRVEWLAARVRAEGFDD
jgi:hypothetical protein